MQYTRRQGTAWQYTRRQCTSMALHHHGSTTEGNAPAWQYTRRQYTSMAVHQHGSHQKAMHSMALHQSGSLAGPWNDDAERLEMAAPTPWEFPDQNLSEGMGTASRPTSLMSLHFAHALAKPVRSPMQCSCMPCGGVSARVRMNAYGCMRRYPNI